MIYWSKSTVLTIVEFLNTAVVDPNHVWYVPNKVLDEIRKMHS